MRLRKPRRRVRCEINIAPLIDVVFLLIIFFMAVSQMTRVEGEPVKLPEAEEGESKEELPAGLVVINVYPDGRLVVFNQAHTLSSLNQLLTGDVRERGAGAVSVLIRADTNTPWEKVGAIMRACAAQGVAKVRVAVVEPEAGASKL